MATHQPNEDTGRAFESRALAIARSIHDPSGTQGSVNFNGREHDGVFINDQTIVAFEFTKMRSKEKATKDAMKIRDLLHGLRRKPENKHKFVHGFFVTADEPTSDQREAVQKIANAANIDIKCLSVVTLRRTLIDTEQYLAKRKDAPFGSTAFKLPTNENYKPIKAKYINPTLINTRSRNDRNLDDIERDATNGSHSVLTGDFGAGKSEAMFQLFERLRKLYFKNSAEERFPLHINLRDCYGLRTPRELLRRHAEEIGFSSENSLISAWRSGACILLLDGFDELVPSRWIGGARDLKQVRWQALEPVRRLVSETPDGSGIVATGRAQYFSGPQELLECLALRGANVYEIRDLDDDQAKQFISDTDAILPDWVPRRALLLKFIIENGLLDELESVASDVHLAWLGMLDIIAAREADRISSITRDSIRRLIARIATTARSGDDNLGPVTIDDMRTAFRDVCGYEADEEGLQLLLRLPGLASTGQGTQVELRRFVDVALADAAYGEDLAEHAASPYSGHPLSESVSWTTSSNALAIGVAAISLQEDGYEPNHIAAAATKRVDNGKFDAVLLDLCNLSDWMGATAISSPPFFSELIIDELSLKDDGLTVNMSTFKDCLIETLDVTECNEPARFPTFVSCMIGQIDGWSQIPERFVSHFDARTEVANYTADGSTTDSLVGLPIDIDSRTALVILKKVYMQAGTGRRESALPRGMPLADRARVPEVTARLISAGYLEKSSHRGKQLVLPIKSRRREVQELLQAPHNFSLIQIGGS